MASFLLIAESCINDNVSVNILYLFFSFKLCDFCSVNSKDPCTFNACLFINKAFKREKLNLCIYV